MDGMIKELLNMKIGAKVGSFNMSAIAYCDDILLISSNEGHMQLLLDKCAEYSVDWKLSFNPSKSSLYSLLKSNFKFKLSGKPISRVDGFIYLGLPVGDNNFIESTYLERMKKCERAFYSLRSIGYSPLKLHP